METKTRISDSPAPADTAQRPSPGFGPTPDPTRSGALWVGGAGVALLLAAAAVLTAVRWDDIGQSAKLGGLVALTLGMLAIGRRCRTSIPMTAQAIFHLGAFLIPFDMAAVAVLAGRSWQETLLLTSLTSVVGWYGIERAVPSVVLKWSARAAMVVLAAGVAAVSPIVMPLALAVAAAVAITSRKATAAGGWAFVAALLPLATFVPWPARIAAAMADLGFDTLDLWQSLAAGVVATLVLVAVARQIQRLEIAWSAVIAGVVTAAVALGDVADSQINYLAIAALFLGLQLLPLFAKRDPLWKPISTVIGAVSEVGAALATIVLLGVAVITDGFNFDPSPTTIGISGVLFALGWLTADVRRLDETEDWLTGVFVGSDWPITTAMFPIAVLAATIGFGAPAFVFALVCVALAYWMVATWRVGATYGALLLVAVAAVEASQTTEWVEFALGGAASAVLALATQLRLRANDTVSALASSFGAVLVWLVASQSAVSAFSSHWPLAIVVAGAWAMSWIAEYGSSDNDPHPAHWMGRLTAIVVLGSSLWVEPVVGLALCLVVAGLAGVDYLREYQRRADARSTQAGVFAGLAGAAVGLAGVPIAELAGLNTTTAGAALTVAGFILAGVALVSPRDFELPLGIAALVTSTVGLAMTLGDENMFAFGLIASGCTTMFVAAAMRNGPAGVVGYGVVGIGVALELAALEVTWLEPYLVMPAIAALFVGWRFYQSGGSSWPAFAPTIALFSYVAIADRFAGGSAWHAVIAGAVGVLAIIGGGYRRLVGPLVTGSAVLAIVAGYESLGPAALVPTWAWLAAGGTVLLGAGVAMERSDTTPLERGQQIRDVIATQFS